MERRLAAILAADVVGYSALMDRDEAGTYKRLVAGRKELFEPEIARHHGRIFKLMGDGLLAEFSSAVDAVECAVPLQRTLAERNASLPESERIQVRIGVNLGEVIVEGDDRYGEGVNIATRLEQLAKAGDVFVSGKVAKEVEKRLAFGFEPMGEQRVKNISEPIPVFRIKLQGPMDRRASVIKRRSVLYLIASAVTVVLVGLAALYGYAKWKDQNEAALPNSRSIVVLPFTNLSDDPQQAYFADGITEDLTTDLSRLPDLFVISRNSAFTYKGKAADARQIGRDLGVRHVLEGSVRRVGEQVRINVQLIDAATGGHMWAERYEGPYADIFKLEDNVTKSVVSALALKLSPGEQGEISQHQTNVPEAYDEFLRGWERYQRNNPDDFKEAIPHFARATQLDQNYGRAYAALAMVYLRGYEQGWSGSLGLTSDDAFRKARGYLKQANLRPSSTAYQVAGNISRSRGWYDDAIKEFNAAIKLDPNDSWNYAELAYTLIWAERPVEAEAQIATAIRLDPHYSSAFAFYRGLSFFGQNRLSDAIASFEEALRLNPEHLEPRLYLAASYAATERAQDASAMIADYSAARIRQGGFPLVRRELQLNTTPISLTLPYRLRLNQYLSKLAIPYNFDDKVFDRQRLSGAEIETLLFGHRAHGRIMKSGHEHGLYISADGKTGMSYGGRFKGYGSARLDEKRLCFVEETTEWCTQILRNPGGTPAKENEYFFFDDWAWPFSVVD
jgi:TolB-like protein/class 3 adenylate cyclase/tetratricopeptide (TPR) repeat protein